MPRTAVTLGDVATEAGVSAATASRVLNGGKSVSPALDSRVRKAAAHVGYISNLAASAMRGRRGLLAILTDELGEESLAELAIAAGTAATTAGLTSTVSSAGAEPQQQLLALRVLRSMGPRSLVLTGSWLSDPTIRTELEAELDSYVRDDQGQVVVLGPPVLPYPTVSFDDYADGYAIATHMAAGGGDTALVLAGAHGDAEHEARTRGIVDGLTAGGIERIHIAHSANDSSVAEVLVRQRASELPFGLVLCVTDRLAVGAHEAAHSLGLRLPQDFALSGIDNLPVANDLEPGLTTIEHPLAKAGQLVVDLALRDESALFRAVLAGEIVVRGTSRS